MSRRRTIPPLTEDGADEADWNNVANTKYRGKFQCWTKPPKEHDWHRRPPDRIQNGWKYQCPRCGRKARTINDRKPR